MSKKAAEHHRKASEHLTMLHGTMAKPPSITKPDNTQSVRITRTAGGPRDSRQRAHAEEAVKAHVEEHGKKWSLVLRPAAELYAAPPVPLYLSSPFARRGALSGPLQRVNSAGIG